MAMTSFEQRFVVSKEKREEFDNKLDVIFNKNEEDKITVTFKSDTVGLFTKHPLLLDDIKCIPSKIPGMINYMMENEELLMNYMTSLDSMLEISKFYKELYDDTIDGPSGSLIRSTKREYKKKK